MLRVLKAAMRFTTALFGAVIEEGAGMFGWIGRTLFEGVTRRSLAAEAADEAAEAAREEATAQAQSQAAARHEEQALLAERQIAETRGLREEMIRQARRRDEIKAMSKAHDPDIRSSRWPRDDDPEPESGAPALAMA